jgi:glycosyltransferase involved in cell wall biosynthesis
MITKMMPRETRADPHSALGKRRIKVLILQISREQSPEYQVCENLAEYAPAELTEVSIVCQSGGRKGTSGQVDAANSPQYLFADFGRNLSIHPRPSRIKRAWMMAKSLLPGLWLLVRQIRAFKPDLLYVSQQRYDMLAARLLAWLFHLPLVIHLHYPVDPSLGAYTIRAVRENPYLITVSEFVRQGAIRAGARPENVKVIPNLIKPEVFTQTHSPHYLRSQFNWNNGEPVIISVGRLDRRKGHEQLLQAFQRVTLQIPNARLLICGASTERTDYGKYLLDIAQRLGIVDAICFAGHRTDISALYAGANLFSLAARDEAFGLVFLEAMASGLPVVAVRSGAVPETVIDHETALLSAPDDAEGLANNLLKLLLDPDLAHRLGEAGLARVWTHYDPHTIATAWAELLARWSVE